ncbi:3-hydroxydecanoyl-ACP dehydratase [Haemophilus paracuniculus]|uniref:3-hydroxydecanoyl-ACP dehydratase n=1 Tax=Haemophilus paracuniculus TaxID=734 RepID=A0A1T0AS67_9PAST|nr:tellurite resistance TerB family protein [Haemophilus paracuniculus]OOR98979.1 3-hydroxydecanoyl-ACP dehydratase [Haemophilus paracuniculus]
MNFNEILNGVLRSVSSTANESKGDLSKVFDSVLNSAKQSAQEIKEGNTDTITKVGGGAALVGILSMVLGKNGGSSLAKLGSLAALGGLAYKAYQNYQQNQSTGEIAVPASEFEQANSESQNELILRTMIAAALADGVLDEAEEALIRKEGGDDAEFQQWLIQQTANPITIDEIARAVGNNTALASQVYLAARITCQELSRKEIVFLAQLATALNLDEALVEQLEKQAGF